MVKNKIAYFNEREWSAKLIAEGMEIVALACTGILLLRWLRASIFWFGDFRYIVEVDITFNKSAAALVWFSAWTTRTYASCFGLPRPFWIRCYIQPFAMVLGCQLPWPQKTRWSETIVSSSENTYSVLERTKVKENRTDTCHVWQLRPVLFVQHCAVNSSLPGLSFRDGMVRLVLNAH